MNIILTFLSLFAISNAYNFSDCPTIPKELSKTQKVGEKLYSNSLDYFFQGKLAYTPFYAFTDIFLQINLTDPDSYSFYQGHNCTIVENLYETDNRYYGLLKRAALLRSHQLNPFNNTIIGVSTKLPYEIYVQVWTVNYIRVIVFIASIILFSLASSLVRNAVFYYTSGCSFGILASLLLVAFIVWRVAPKKTIGVPILIGGWSVSLYMLHFAWTNLQSIMIEYQKYVIGYFTLVILISWAVCYKRGPPTDARSHDIAQWTLQLLAVTLIYFSTQVSEVAYATIAILVIQQLTQTKIAGAIKWYMVGLGAFWRKMFPKPRKLLTEEEYQMEGEKTTREQLALLRKYCQEERNRPWKLAGTVRNARRLSKFVEGEMDHVTDDEMYAHDMTGEILERDDLEDEEDDEIELEDRQYETRRRQRGGESYGRDDSGDDWDEIVVRRAGSSNRRGGGGSSLIRSVKVPRSVSNRLLRPYEFLNHTIDGEDSYRRNVDYSYRDSPQRTPAAEPLRHRQMTAQTEVRPRISKQLNYNREEELVKLRMQIAERKRQMEKNRLSPKSAKSTVGASSSSSMSNSEMRRNVKNRSPRRKTYIESDSEDC